MYSFCEVLLICKRFIRVRFKYKHVHIYFFNRLRESGMALFIYFLHSIFHVISVTNYKLFTEKRTKKYDGKL